MWTLSGLIEDLIKIGYIMESGEGAKAHGELLRTAASLKRAGIQDDLHGDALLVPKLPDGVVIDNSRAVSVGERDRDYVTLRVPVTSPSWQWPEWLRAGCVFRVGDGRWLASNVIPNWDIGLGDWMYCESDCTGLEHTAFVPPPIYKDSKPIHTNRDYEEKPWYRKGEKKELEPRSVRPDHDGDVLAVADTTPSDQ